MTAAICPVLLGDVYPPSSWGYAVLQGPPNFLLLYLFHCSELCPAAHRRTSPGAGLTSAWGILVPFLGH